MQRQLGQILIDSAYTKEYRYLCTTVSPYNIASIKDKFQLGLSIKALNVVYGFLTRYIMNRDLVEDVNFEGDRVVVSMGATEEQHRLLKSGFIGTEIEPFLNDWNVTYRKFVK